MRPPPDAIIAELQQQLDLLKQKLIDRGLGSPELFRALERLVNAAVRGAAAGLVLRGGLHLVSQTLALLSSKRRAKRAIGLSDALGDTLRYIAFLGSLGGVFVAVDEGIAALFGKTRTAGWRALIAGACAGPSLLWTGSHPHNSMATYVFLRGLTLLVRTGNRPTAHPLLSALLAPTRAPHGDALLMCLAASQILYSFVVQPQSLPPAYIRFITRATGKEPHVWAACKELAFRNSTGLPPSPLAALRHTPLHAHSRPTPCGIIHPGRHCAVHALSEVPAGWLRSLQVYLPVYVLPAILVHRRKLLQEPQLLWPKIATGVARSSLFLALYIGLAFGGVCAGHGLAGKSTGSVIAASVAVAGLSVLAEKKSRRMELALYCSARALESFGQCLVEWGWVARRQVPLRMDVVLFSAATAAIMHCYSDGNGRHRDVFRSKYLNWFDFVFGNTGVQEGRITHKPSNLDLFQALEQRARRTLMPRSSSYPMLAPRHAAATHHAAPSALRPNTPPGHADPLQHTPRQTPPTHHHTSSAGLPSTPLAGVDSPLASPAPSPTPHEHTPSTRHPASGPAPLQMSPLSASARSSAHSEPSLFRRPSSESESSADPPGI